ncbi:MAG: FtsX-like permease family protein, partial [Ruminococcus sp.]|nr:FtsX-like permease family protein [Ruminococcus sp.]
FKTQMTAEELKDLMTSLVSSEKTTYDSNLKKLGYAELGRPSAITIYPLDFDSKNRVKDIISAYNTRMEAAGNEEKIIEYTDMVDALMGSVTTIIDAISYILIAFVAISLIVSSIMIGVITYISVLERRKEIGILRAIGASKHNISTVFNAETFIIGALAGVIGIVISELIILIANPILHSLTGQDNINAILPPAAALILIVLSVILTLIGGIIPSRKAAKSDPVTALRSE